jgi:hypothetical protein
MKEERFMESLWKAMEACERAPVVRVSWPAIFGGTLFGFAIMLILGLCGLSIGPTMLRPAEVAGGVRIWAGIWSLVTVFFGFLGGGWLAAKTSSGTTQDGWLHGMLVWCLGSIAIFYFAVNSTPRMASFLAGITGNMLGGAVESLTFAAATWSFLSAICGLIGGTVGGQAGVYQDVTVREFRRVA